jgi:class 3 adenylate cyclase/DNA-binding NarL/FixJ family response regulator
MSATATVAVLFCDVVGSTERLIRLGDEAGDVFRRHLFHQLRQCVSAAGGTEVKNLGDGLMVVFQHSTTDALACASDMHAQAAGLEPDDPVRLRIGISVGEVAQEDDDWFGTPVVEAARLCRAAGGGQTLAPELVETLVGSRHGGHRFRRIGPMSLKGLTGEMSVVEVDGEAVDSTDPDSTDLGSGTPSVGSPEEPPTDRSVRFISIDDHPSISDALQRAANDYDDVEMIGSFTSIESVPKPFRDPGALVDVAVLDLNLAGVGGLAGVESVSAWGVAVLVFSADTSSRVATECLNHGAAGFISKSLPTLQVLDAVRAVGRGERVLAGADTGDSTGVRLSPGDERLLEALTRESRSRDLAVRLSLSPRTVDNLIADLYWKIGLEGADRSRAGLRDWARRNGYGGPTSS